MIFAGMKHKLLTLLIVFISLSVAGQTHWESIVTESDQFNYLVPVSTPDPEWKQLGFDDSVWNTAPGGFGYGDDDDNTYVYSTTSIYLRKVFEMPAGIVVSSLYLDIDYDDAFIAYLNGKEIARSSNLPAGTPGYTAQLTTDHEAQIYSGGMPDRFVLNPGELKTGDNILAVQVLNHSTTSSDLSARVFLNAKISGETIIFNQVPDWFEVPVSELSSNLPIVNINTQGRTIIDEPKIMAKMQVIDNSSGFNSLGDNEFTYDGFIGIEIRGNTSQMYPKKSYTVETRLSDGSNNNVELLGFPKENDWVFHGPYSDKSLMRNALAYSIGNKMGDWNPRTRYVELIINNEYRGIYLVVEKIKIDNDRVDIATLKPDDLSGDQVTGGYIISIDRDQEGSWNSPIMGRTGSVDIPFSYVDPKYDELAPAQRYYIRNHITEFEYVLQGENFKDPQSGYRSYIDVKSFVDFFILTELSRDLDGYRVSVYFHKDKDSKGGKLTMGPFWDFNICFGNADFMQAWSTTGWAEEGIGAGDWYEIPFWWDRFREDPYFETMLKYRWEELREDVLHKTTINNFIDSCQILLSDAQKRNFDKFNVLNSYVWPNKYIGGSFQNEVMYLKTWISNRINWLDLQMDAIEPSYPSNADELVFEENKAVVYPNPFKENVTVEFEINTTGNVKVAITNIMGQTVAEKSNWCIPGRNVFNFSSAELGTNGNIFFYTILFDNQKTVSGKLIRK
jgi:hypothetical protein